MKYEILDTENNKMYANELINKTFEGTEIGEYIEIYYNNNKYMFLATEVKKVKQCINKSKVINALHYIDKAYKDIAEIKDIIRYRKLLTKRTNADIESITHAYNEIVDIYVLSSKGLYHWYIQSFLQDAIKEIMKSSIAIESYNKEYLDYLVKYNLL